MKSIAIALTMITAGSSFAGQKGTYADLSCVRAAVEYTVNEHFGQKLEYREISVKEDSYHNINVTVRLKNGSTAILSNSMTYDSECVVEDYGVIKSPRL